MSKRLFGYIPDPEGVEEILQDSETNVRVWTGSDDIELDVTGVGIEDDKESIVLLDAVLSLIPGWKRGAQGIGDCVSWGWELACLISICVDIIHKKQPWVFPGEVATEPIYGGSRVEARGRSRGGYSDGSYGGAAAKWVTKWGVLHRLNYALKTGVRDHNLQAYSAQRAKDWGNFGCGGDQGPQLLDEIAKTRPVQEAPQVTSFEEYVACIESGYPVAICSSRGLSKRDSDGFANPQGIWMHCMLGGGVRYGRRPGGLISNSWGNSWGTKAPLPGVDHDEIKKCSAWVDAKVIDQMLKQNDSYAVTGVDGLVRREIDWESIWHVTGRV